MLLFLLSLFDLIVQLIHHGVVLFLFLFDVFNWFIMGLFVFLCLLIYTFH